MTATARDFPSAARRALLDAGLRRALGNIKAGFRDKRAAALARFPEFTRLCEEAARTKDETLANLDLYLETFAAKVEESGGRVHWCRNEREARAAVMAICRAAGATTVTKSKSMIAEEIGLNAELEQGGIAVVETDLGEYVAQLRHERPSHIIAPIIHLSRGEIAASFRAAHRGHDEARRLETARELMAEARAILRAKFLAAEVGITGANLLVAETGQAVIVTNEGNADLTLTLPRVHVVIASIEKLVARLDDACTILRVLAPSATGQDVTAYTTFVSGPRRAGETDGPRSFHVVLLDNRRAELLGSEFRDILRCIRCAACLNHCPVYAAVGGHAYGAVFPGPMGAVLTPWLVGIAEAAHLPNASTLCGRCEEVCPMGIPLPLLLRRWREREARLPSRRARLGMRLWAFAAARPALYRLAARAGARWLAWLARGRRWVSWLPGLSAWTRSRDFPAPQGETFQALWARRLREGR